MATGENLQDKFGLTAEQMKEFRASFNIFDTDTDGTINVKELGDVLRQLGQDPTEAEIQDIINDADDNGDGVLQFEEFLALMVKRNAPHKDDKQEFHEAFKVFDQDGDGFIDQNELKIVMAKVGENLTEKEIEDMVRQADKNGDGKIDYQEFVQMMGLK